MTVKKQTKKKKVFMITFEKWFELVLRIFVVFLILLGIALIVVYFIGMAITEYCPCL